MITAHELRTASANFKLACQIAGDRLIPTEVSQLTHEEKVVLLARTDNKRIQEEILKILRVKSIAHNTAG